jgi:hypothetical protein
MNWTGYHPRLNDNFLFFFFKLFLLLLLLEIHQNFTSQKKTHIHHLVISSKLGVLPPPVFDVFVPRDTTVALLLLDRTFKLQKKKKEGERTNDNKQAGRVRYLQDKKKGFFFSWLGFLGGMGVDINILPRVYK